MGTLNEPNFITSELRNISLQITCDQNELTELVLNNVFSLRRSELCFNIAYLQIIRSALRSGNYSELPKSLQAFYKNRINLSR